jgi:hypothetical protein
MKTKKKAAKLKRHRLTTALDRHELRQFKKVAKFVRGHCGPVSDAEVLRYLVRNWSESSTTTWFVDTVNGNDTNDGLTSKTPLRTPGELRRRMGVDR